ncbi:hypothetical protein OPKNFCMD_6357 [Methylobacterium crusticola]|uniref:Uncharacterized protein n=1 Tax=Methylobacterium crusticola TaxID=1697972 RepID=A0ABQ4R788_9HYPH|nr:hypothetical protein OPKNFCMD_6357 [Methylobacterium crusticola]
MNTPPIGRVTKPTPNVATDAKRLIQASPDGKKVRPIVTAKNAYVVKS